MAELEKRPAEEPLGVLRFLGEPFQIDRGTCAGCGRLVLIVSRPGKRGRSALYDRISLDCSIGQANPSGARHDCPGRPAQAQELPGLNRTSGGQGAYLYRPPARRGRGSRRS